MKNDRLGRLLVERADTRAICEEASSLSSSFEGAGRQVVLVAGCAVAGSSAIAQFAKQGILTIAMEQNQRPYGKIEDGLPRWHVKLRRQEYDKINAKLDHPNVRFLPLTKMGHDITLEEILGWGLSAVCLAIGADRKSTRLNSSHLKLSRMPSSA